MIITGILGVANLLVVIFFLTCLNILGIGGDGWISTGLQVRRAPASFEPKGLRLALLCCRQVH